MDYKIRDAVQQDMTQVLELIQELATFEKEPDAVEVTVDELIKEGFGENPLFHCFVAEVNQEIVGIALVYYRFSTWKGRSVHLEDLIVKESMRGTGLGSALYAEVMKYAKSKGVRRVEWVVLDWNKNAIDFYEKSGATLLKDWYLAQMDQENLNTFVSKL
ncbi:GNAT family N-acetyltransferase [Aquimarina sp. MMG016]|uniref:GNAT family N-acetyltransferase n=1 Tax=Aquimarina sp. MMG016 TaxID=2822690 RepID=UPI001B3A780C|nr:GNAT family N-acetyltransferase [Aquimarina sp. MMG016]MBQ4818937.1 GNAT family N-acetyltransferase [Aquimarina sp. MMG016]